MLREYDFSGSMGIAKGFQACALTPSVWEFRKSLSRHQVAPNRPNLRISHRPGHCPKPPRKSAIPKRRSKRSRTQKERK